MGIISITTPTPKLPGYSDLTYIGAGGTGTTYYATSNRDNKRVIIKEYVPYELRATIFRDKNLCLDYSNVSKDICNSILNQIKHEQEIANRLKKSESGKGDLAAVFYVTQIPEAPFYAEMGTFAGERFDKAVIGKKSINLLIKLKLLEKALNSLYHFHVRDIIHMDFNPRNAMVVFPNEDDTYYDDAAVSIFDFGSCIDSNMLKFNEGKEESLVTTLSASVDYMSPEVYKIFSCCKAGEDYKEYVSKIGINTDLYAYGVMFLETLLGYSLNLECCISHENLKYKIVYSKEIPEYLKLPLFAFLKKLIYCDESELGNQRYDNYYHDRDNVEATYRAIFNDLETLIKIVKSEGVHPAIILAEAENIAIKIRDDLDPEKGFIEEMLPDIVEVE